MRCRRACGRPAAGWRHSKGRPATASNFVAELGGDVPAGAEPVFKSDQDATEYALLRWFVAERAIPFIDFWANAIITIAEGNGLTIRPEDVPPWTDED